MELTSADIGPRRVIRAAPGEETTGNYIVVIEKETSHSTFEHIADEVRNESLDHRIAEKVEGPFAKIIAAKMTEEAAHRVSYILFCKIIILPLTTVEASVRCRVYRGRGFCYYVSSIMGCGSC